MDGKFKSPVTFDEAFLMVAPLDPHPANLYSEEEKRIAFDRLIEFLRVLLPEN